MLRLLWLLLIAVPTLAAEKKPNIIFILADDLGYGDVGCYGQTKIRTPHIDALAKDGLRFTQAYAGSTVCAPSRCCLMTGLHTGHARIRGNAKVSLEPTDLTVAEALKQQGYTTGLVGKWGLGNEGSTGVPTKKGFDTFFGYLDQVHAHNYYPDFLVRGEENIPLKNVVKGGVSSNRVEYSPDLFLNEGLSFLEKNREKPFFLYFASILPHANNEAKQAGMEVPSDEPYTAEKWPQAQKNHAAMITRLDATVGRLMAKLKELKLDDQTIVFFSSDNGPHREGGADPLFFNSSGPLNGIKRAMTDGGIRVPFIVRWPGHIKPGTTDAVTAFWDFLPTALELAASSSKPKAIDGQSIVPVLLGQPGYKPHDMLYWEFHENGSKQAVRFGNYKAIRPYVGATLQLFDLATDLGEKQNIADKHPEVIAKVEAYLKTARTESPHWPLTVAKKKEPK